MKEEETSGNPPTTRPPQKRRISKNYGACEISTTQNDFVTLEDWCMA